MTAHTCPLCQQSVSNELYQKITGLDKARDEEIRGLNLRLEKSARDLASANAAAAKRAKEFDTQLKSLLANQEKQTRALAAERRRAILAQRKSAQTFVEVRAALEVDYAKRTKKTVEAAQEANRQAQALQKQILSQRKELAREKAAYKKSLDEEFDARITAGVKAEVARMAATPQKRGLSQEVALVEMLCEAMPSDGYETPGNRGDVIQTVAHEPDAHDKIVYESKRGKRITSKDRSDAIKAKRKAKAAFVVLVHTGTCRGYNGLLFDDRDIIITTPTGAVAIGQILRAHLVERHRLNKSANRHVTDLKTRELLAFLRGSELLGLFKQMIVETERDGEQIANERTKTEEWWAMRTKRVVHLRTLADTIAVKIAEHLEKAEAESPAGSTHPPRKASHDRSVPVSPTIKNVLRAVCRARNVDPPSTFMLRRVQKLGFIDFDPVKPQRREAWRLTAAGLMVAHELGLQPPANVIALPRPAARRARHSP